MELKFYLKVDYIEKNEYQGKSTIKVQALKRSDDRGLEVIKIKLIDEILNFKVGDYISIPVRVSAMDSKVFFTQNGKIELVKGS